MNYGHGGVFNPAYHDSETLEIDRRFSRKPPHANPYAGDDPNGAEWRAPREGWGGRENIPMGPMSTHTGSPSWQHDLSHSTFQIDQDRMYDRLPPVRPYSSAAGNMTMRWRGLTMRRMSVFPNSDPAHAAFTEDAIMSEMENEEQDLVKELVALSITEQIKKIRELPRSFEEKKHIRRQVRALKSSERSRQFTCLSNCSKNMSLSMRRFGYSVKSAKQTLELWHSTMKEIGGKFGSSVLNYFVLLKWLLMFNIFSFLINFGFITIPLLIYDHSPNTPANMTFRGLELLTGAGYFNYTIMYYGSYSNETVDGLVNYDMKLAYFFTISVYMVFCGIVLIFSMASSFKKNYAMADPSSNSAWQLLHSWDFSITNENAVNQRKNNIRIQLKESLAEKAHIEQKTLPEKLQQYGIYLGSWLLSTGLAVACGVSIFYLCKYEDKQTVDTERWSLQQEAETLLVPFVVSLMNMVVPLLFSLFNKFEHYSSQSKQIYALLFRNVLLRISILGVLCYHWMNVVPLKFTCWEPMVGQALYRLVIVDFIFLMLGSFFGEFLSNVIGTKIQPRLGVPEFDVARNILEIIYAQTLAWIGIYFSPLLPVIQILKFFILFFIKKVSLTQNCQPPRRSGRAAQMKTIIIFLLFFPFFMGALSIVAYTSWSLTPSEGCGPFRGLNRTFGVIEGWIDDVDKNFPGSKWAVWIYDNVIKSELFFFLITLIILVIIYIFWQLAEGRKELIILLREQIVNEGQDKSFLLDRLQNLQRSGPKVNNQPKKQKTRNKPGSAFSGSPSNSNAVVQVLLARQQVEEQERRSVRGSSVPLDISTTDAMTQAILARQKAEREDENVYNIADENPPSLNAVAQSLGARQRAEENDQYWSTTNFNQSNPVNRLSMRAGQRAEGGRGEDSYDGPSSASNVMAQVMQARQRVEEEERNQWTRAPGQNPAPSGSSALIQAMLARQQVQDEYDDGY
ncbi:PREDICTED: transmembrane channel-like protein 5 [Cyprinodon variegatus]|uniref:transmembrane channel-like protein 5 n=1 Tax=Cyprinodon variegatus TaxID=28743 RepID=UPI000742B9A7|nr:PREDICTED: transmembrane channel-like protein 5 [Cyprinodon variegatus]XP_015237139.1 PREDICTED: transmembrane channel-like protein 5 [Cyprinodon variegatus]